MKIGKNFLLTKKIELGEEFGAEDPSEAYIVFSEPDTAEVLALKQAGEDTPDKILDLMGKHIHEHNFTDENGVALSNSELMEVVRHKSLAAIKIINEYSNWIADPFQKKTKQK